jgi:hypothetical protein
LAVCFIQLQSSLDHRLRVNSHPLKSPLPAMRQHKSTWEKLAIKTHCFGLPSCMRPHGGSCLIERVRFCNTQRLPYSLDYYWSGGTSRGSKQSILQARDCKWQPRRQSSDGHFVFDATLICFSLRKGLERLLATGKIQNDRPLNNLS